MNKTLSITLPILLFVMFSSLQAGTEGLSFADFLGAGQNSEFTQIDTKLSRNMGQEVSYKIAYTKWTPKESNGRVIIYNHGLQSHRGWFNQTAARFMDEGYTLYAFDRIGTGDSSPGKSYVVDAMNRENDHIEGTMGHIRSWKLFIETLDQMISIAQKEHPATDIYLWANSYGAKVVTAYLMRHGLERGIAGTIFTTPGIYRNKKSMPLPVAKWKFLFAGHMYHFPTPIKAEGNDNGAHWFTSDPHFTALIAGDSKSTRKITANFYLQTNKLDKYISKYFYHNDSLASIPRFYAMVEGDLMMDNTKMERMLRRRSENITAKFYQGGSDHKHFVTFTSDKEEVLADILLFLEGQANQINNRLGL